MISVLLTVSESATAIDSSLVSTAFSGIAVTVSGAVAAVASGVAATVSGIAAALTGLPHIVQNLAPGFKAAPQTGQTAGAAAGSVAAAGWGFTPDNL